MSAASEKHGNPAHIHLSVGTERHFKELRLHLIDKDRNLHTCGKAELAYDSLQILSFHTVEIHLPSFQISDYAFAILEQNALCQHTAHNLILKVCFLVKGLIDDPAEIKSCFHQLTGNPHGFRCCGRILEYAGVMCHSRINRNRNGTVDLICIQKSVKNFTCGTDVAPYMIDICKSLIAYMMVNACGLFCRVKILSGNSKTIQCADITGDKKIILFLFFCFCLNLIHSVDVIKYRLRLFQINICLNIRKILPDIKVQSHTGADAVSIRTDVAANAYGFYIFQYF